MIPAWPDPAAIVACDCEPIRCLGAVQPVGFLLSVSESWILVRASENVDAYLGAKADQIIGQPAQAVLPPDLLHAIRGRLQMAAGADAVERLFGRRLAAEGQQFDIAIHRSGAEIVLEFEISAGESEAPLATLRSMLARIEIQNSRPALLREAARQIRALTGFDRVVVYRFDADGAGEIVAESIRSGLSPYLGLRYPASDIPAEARALYERNRIRIVVDVDAEPAPIRPLPRTESDALDLSMSILRCASPIHLEYLRNMGVRTSMSVSILLDGKLWGLIICHHGERRHVGFEMRSTAELFGRMFSHQLQAREREDEVADALRAGEIRRQFVGAFAERAAPLKELPALLEGFKNHIASDGVGVYRWGDVSLAGSTPTADEFLKLVGFLNKTAPARMFSTHCLSDIFPAAADYVTRAAGVLSIPISQTPRDYIVFFRREAARIVTWAGEPAKPRKSFEAWQEVVRRQSEPWSKRDLYAAEALRSTLIEALLHMTEAALTDRAGARQRQEILIAELNHRVRNILALVRGLITQSAALTDDIGVLVANLDERIHSMARAHDLLHSGSWRPASLFGLLCAEIDTYSQSERRVTLLGPDVLLQPKAFTAMALVAHELVTNALKYGALANPHGRITVETSSDRAGGVTVTWTESGGPPVAAPTRRGFGSAILEQIIPFDVNGVSEPKYLATGFVLDVVLPASVAQCDDSQAVESAPRPDAFGEVAGENDINSLLRSCLLVEDNLFIAVDAEDMLRKVGADAVEVARSVAEALAAVSRREFSFALLDVNLGAETSGPIAMALRARGVPFAFGTGYGESMEREKLLADAPILSKPYHRADFIKALTRLVRTSASGPETSRDA